MSNSDNKRKRCEEEEEECVLDITDSDKELLFASFTLETKQERDADEENRLGSSNWKQFHSARSKEPEHPIIVKLIEDMRKELEEKGILLTVYGILPAKDKKKYDRANLSNTCDVRTVQMALTDIPKYLSLNVEKEKLPKRIACASGSLKSVLESQRRRESNESYYLTQGDFAMACLLLGAPIRRAPGMRSRFLLYVDHLPPGHK